MSSPEVWSLWSRSRVYSNHNNNVFSLLFLRDENKDRKTEKRYHITWSQDIFSGDLSLVNPVEKGVNLNEERGKAFSSHSNTSSCSPGDLAGLANCVHCTKLNSQVWGSLGRLMVHEDLLLYSLKMPPTKFVVPFSPCLWPQVKHSQGRAEVNNTANKTKAAPRRQAPASWQQQSRVLPTLQMLSCDPLSLLVPSDLSTRPTLTVSLFRLLHLVT